MAVRVGNPCVDVLCGDGMGPDWVGVIGAVDEGVPVRAPSVAGALGWPVNTAAMVRYTCVGLGVGVVSGRLLAEIRLITCHNKKITPAATSSQTNTVSKLKRTGVPFLTAMILIYYS